MMESAKDGKKEVSVNKRLIFSILMQIFYKRRVLLNHLPDTLLGKLWINWPLKCNILAAFRSSFLPFKKSFKNDICIILYGGRRYPSKF